MSNFELIDDYLSNRLNGSEKEAFEKQLENDPSLKSDLDFQKQIVEGIRTARATELKSMLSKVPIGGTTVSMDFSVVKMAAGIVAAGVVGAAIYFYATHGELPPFNKAATDFNQKTEEIKKPEATEPDATEVVTDSTGEKESTPAPIKESAKPKQEPVKSVEKPKLDVTDPSSDLQQDNSSDSEPTANIRRGDIAPSHVQVNIDSSNKKFDFHYQFVGNKLMLFGDFDRSLYEVLEINGDNHALFFVYKDAYYLLDENQHKATKLEAIRDASLISKLKDYRKG